jgi:hypothetical protein
VKSVRLSASACSRNENKQAFLEPSDFPSQRNEIVFLMTQMAFKPLVFFTFQPYDITNILREFYIKLKYFRNQNQIN